MVSLVKCSYDRTVSKHGGGGRSGTAGSRQSIGGNNGRAGGVEGSVDVQGGAVVA